MLKKYLDIESCLLLLLLIRFSRVQLCATSETAAHQAPPSLGFSRQEHWSGLPFPSPMHESEKSKRSRSVVPDSSRPHGLQPTRLLRPRDFPGKRTGVECHRLLPRAHEPTWNRFSAFGFEFAKFLPLPSEAVAGMSTSKQWQTECRLIDF